MIDLLQTALFIGGLVFILVGLYLRRLERTGYFQSRKRFQCIADKFNKGELDECDIETERTLGLIYLTFGTFDHKLGQGRLVANVNKRKIFNYCCLE